MYQCHGWAVLNDSPEESDADLLARLAHSVESRIAEIGSENPLAAIHVLNGQHHLAITGFANHRNQGAIAIEKLFCWIPSIAPGSYGLLHIWDDEDPDGCDNEFRVWVMARGKLAQQRDPYLSPCIPKIEDPYPAD
jgi:hypothetical protein